MEAIQIPKGKPLGIVGLIPFAIVFIRQQAFFAALKGLFLIFLPTEARSLSSAAAFFRAEQHNQHNDNADPNARPGNDA